MPTAIFRLAGLDKLGPRARRRQPQNTVTVVVECSKGHKNVFRVKRRPT